MSQYDSKTKKGMKKMSRLKEIKESFNRGVMKIEDIKFLIDHIESQNSEIKYYELSMSRARKEIKTLKETTGR